MKPIDIIILVLLGIAVVGIIAFSVWQKRKGKTNGCGCGCNGCKGCSSANTCNTAKHAAEEETPTTNTDEKIE